MRFGLIFSFSHIFLARQKKTGPENKAHRCNNNSGNTAARAAVLVLKRRFAQSGWHFNSATAWLTHHTS